MRILLALALLLAGGCGARAEALVVSLSSDEVAINSNFTGAEVALFGSIQRDGATATRGGDYDVVVTMRGPRGSVMVREKKSFGPFWINLAEQRFIAVPAFIAVLSNRPLAAIAGGEIRDKLHVGLKALVPARSGADAQEPRFRAALIRIRENESLFREASSAVKFLAPSLFRATLRLPGTAPLGAYDVEIALFADGVRLADATQSFTVVRGGFERAIVVAAREDGLLYGLATAGLAVLVGWLATLIFRRE